MKFLTLSLLVLLSSLPTPSWAFGSSPKPILKDPKFLVISDIDDTIKMTHVNDKWDAVKNGLFGNSSFTGMSSLYQSWVEAQNLGQIEFENSPFIYVSGSPFFLRRKLEDFLDDNGFPNGPMVLRKTKALFKSVASYKTSVFEMIAKSDSTPKILVGDDTESDPEVIADFGHRRASETLAKYIHIIQNRPLPPDVTPFVLASDVVDFEVKAGRLSIPQAEAVITEVSKAPLDEIIPDFMHCPTSGQLPRVSQIDAFKASTQALADRVHADCQRREAAEK